MEKRKKLVVLTGAGISAESGVKTFRDHDGLWENYDVMEVASIEGWHRNPELMQQFYNERRTQLATVQPNEAHTGLAELEETFEVSIVTQNVDDLHERGGSTHIVHLHGELTKICNSSKTQIQEIGYQEIQHGQKASDGSLLRPFIVWFGEAVPLMDEAINLVSNADILVIIGTSLNVYPAAGLVDFAPAGCKLFLIDPQDVGRNLRKDCLHLQCNAAEGVKRLKHLLSE